MDEIKEFINGQDVSLVVIGGSLSGKTSYCINAMNKTSLQNILVLEYESLDTHTDLVSRISNFVTTPRTINNMQIGSIDSLLKQASIDTYKILFLDDVDILFSQDRYANNYIQEIIGGKYPYLKVIMTCTACEERKTTDVKKKSRVVRLANANANANANNANIDPHKTYFDMNIYQVVEHLFDNRDKGLDDTELAASLDPTLISFMMYDNYKAYFCNNYNLDHPSSQCVNKIMSDISLAYMHTSVIEDFVFNTNDWNLSELASIIRCHMIRLCQRDLQVLPLAKLRTTDIQYTQITSRSAQHYNIMKKNMAVSELTSDNVMYMAQMHFLNKQLQTKKIDLKTNVGAVCQAFIFNMCDSMPKKKKKILGI